MAFPLADCLNMAGARCTAHPRPPNRPQAPRPAGVGAVAARHFALFPNVVSAAFLVTDRGLLAACSDAKESSLEWAGTDDQNLGRVCCLLASGLKALAKIPHRRTSPTVLWRP